MSAQQNVRFVRNFAEAIAVKHGTAVEGYEGRLPELVRNIHRMCYNEVVEFYRLAIEELRQQAENDRAKGRTQLAEKLDEAANTVDQLRMQFARIWQICEPHMEVEK